MIKIRTSLMERLFRNRFIDDTTQCWRWTGATTKKNNGYGVIFDGGGKQITVHRAAASIWLSFDINSPLFVCHTCDVRRCFNPKHLFIGTRQDNITDMWNKNRGPNQRHPRKLTKALVIEIYNTYKSGGETTRSLAIKYGIGKSIVGSIVRKEAWSHLWDTV